ncbi:MAG: hypothetical protein U0Q11_13170 [Vicinamibacterales bacterium]
MSEIFHGDAGHKNIKQIALALERLRFCRIVQVAPVNRVRRLIVTAKNDRLRRAGTRMMLRLSQDGFLAMDAELRRLNTALQTLARAV